ncbi:hypothetical protein [Roseovarius sp. MMSF_3281]|uniref:AtuA-related protein n=1 Tax=Roseovarius sp. MMSF_3281 TaxID=3046694 RepID=UPI00273F464D|nr:hypothetical protein [Roseovarius sp. MMSF_3281]
MTEMIPIHALAHARSGDKGNRQNISVIPYDPTHWDHLVTHVTEPSVRELFGHRGVSKVTRFLLPGLPAMNFVLDDALEGGVNSSLALDTHGKSASFLLLGLLIPPAENPADT